MRFILESPVGNTRGPAYTELLLQTLHRAGTQAPVTLRIESNAGQVGLGIDCQDPVRKLLLQEIQDAYPGLKVRGVHGIPAEAEDCCGFVELSKIPDVLTLRRARPWLWLCLTSICECAVCARTMSGALFDFFWTQLFIF